MLEFKKKQLNKSYKITTEANQRVIAGSFEGCLTDIPTKEIIEGMIARGSNLVAAIKEQVSTAPAADAQQ